MQHCSTLPRWVWVAVLTGLASVGAACSRESAVTRDVSNSGAGKTESTTIADFQARVNTYVALQKQLSATVGPLDVTRTPVEISERERALGRAIIAARAGARAGDIFTAPAAALFRAAIRDEFAHRSRLVLEDRDEAQDELPNFTPAVNQVYPTTYPLATFPAGVLTRVPALPEPLEYRFVQRNLILRDVQANLIVDVLPDAAPAMDTLTSPREETKAGPR